GDRVMLIVEDDMTFARILVDLAHERGLKALVAGRGGTAIALAREFKPDVITLDIGLPDMAGWTILDRLKHEPGTRHIPVHVITGEANRRRALALGAMTFLQKAAEQEDLPNRLAVIKDSAQQAVKRLVVVSPNPDRITRAVSAKDIEIVPCEGAEALMEIAGRERVDGIVIDAGASDSSVILIIDALQRRSLPYMPPVIVVSDGELPGSELSAIARLGQLSAVRYAPSMDHLLDETVLLLHRQEAPLSDEQRAIISRIHETDPILENKRVLVVDDDLRNIFALTSLLEHHNIHVLHAENGRTGIELLKKNPDIDIVLMDIMMPEMDGYETMRAIRKLPQFTSLPIIALTAKAMKGDREKCIDAGASDYVTKPVELEQLFSVMRVWAWQRTYEMQPQLLPPSGSTQNGSHDSHHGEWRFDTSEDDRGNIIPGDPVLLVIEDDLTFARILVEMAHERGLKALIASTGNTALTLAREFKPNAITLDITLPDMAGWAILDRLKHDAMTRHIPVHIISGDENRRRGLALGAMTYVEKAVDQENLAKTFGIIRESTQRRRKKVLAVSVNVNAIESAIGADDILVSSTSNAHEALSIINEQYLDGIIIDIGSPGQSALELVREVQARISPYTPPVILFGSDTGAGLADLTPLLNASAIRYAPTLDRLLDESVVLLHRSEEDLSAEQQRILREVRNTDPVLAGKKVLVVDDDVRNIFALTSVLQHHKLEVVHANNGRDGIDLLENSPGVDAVLMDIMMPEMDGYETIRAIRQRPRFANLPVIALTAKAMKGDRDKCLQAGASDYVAKPVDLEQLFSVLRVCIAKITDAAKNATSGKE
ncbi:MAG TPA: response regulator, partial [Bryobacteraceae bacterium]|nr:response regulator [Bryobacteraceae bacterium]